MTNLITTLRSYNILPETAEQAQEIADWLVGQGEDVSEPTMFNDDFREFPVIFFLDDFWAQGKKAWHDISLTYSEWKAMVNLNPEPK